MVERLISVIHIDTRSICTAARIQQRVCFAAPRWRAPRQPRSAKARTSSSRMHRQQHSQPPRPLQPRPCTPQQRDRQKRRSGRNGSMQQRQTKLQQRSPTRQAPSSSRNGRRRRLPAEAQAAARCLRPLRPLAAARRARVSHLRRSVALGAPQCCNHCCDLVLSHLFLSHMLCRRRRQPAAADAAAPAGRTLPLAERDAVHQRRLGGAAPDERAAGADGAVPRR